MNQEAIRQRRNLVVTSIAVTFFYLSGDANIKFFDVSLNDVVVAEPAAWLAILFFVWRFSVHSNDALRTGAKTVISLMHTSQYLSGIGKVVILEYDPSGGAHICKHDDVFTAER